MGEPKLSETVIASEHSDGNLSDRFLRSIEELKQRLDKRPLGKNFDFAKSYLDEEVIVAYYVRTIGPRFQAKYYRAVYQHQLAGFQSVGFESDRFVWKCDLGENRHARIVSCDGHQKFVFVDDVETVKLPEQKSASRVWLQSADSLYSFGGCPKQISESVVEVFDACTYRELSIASSRSVSRDEVISEQIEGRSKIMNNVPDDAAPFGWDRTDFNFACCASRFSVYLGSDGVRVGVPEEFYFSFQFIKMALGPIDLYPRTKKVAICHGTPDVNG